MTVSFMARLLGSWMTSGGLLRKRAWVVKSIPYHPVYFTSNYLYKIYRVVSE
jgi:hypothetical protein